MIVGYLISCKGGCGKQMLTTRDIPHWCDACLERISDDVDYPIGQVQG